MAEETDFGFKIKQLREQKNISQEELAEALQISQSKLSKIENGRIKKIDVILIKKFCSFFSVNMEEFFTADSL